MDDFEKVSETDLEFQKLKSYVESAAEVVAMDVKEPDLRVVAEQEHYIGFKRLFCMIALEDESAAAIKSQESD